MKKRILKCNILSEKSINNLIKSLEDYADSLEVKAKLFAQKLAEKGVEVARLQITSLDAIFSGELIRSIHTEEISNENGKAIFAVVADSEHAIYVEMGTGMIGAENPYPGKLPAVYAQGAYGKANMERTGKYYWFYQRDSNWYYTEGMPSRPFMYNTSLELYRIVENVAREIFGNGK
jgi:hypothetical protein